MGGMLTKSATLDFGIQWSLFVVATLLKTEKFYDLAGSGTFALLAYKSLKWGGTYFLRQKVQSGMVIAWAIRLGFYLFTRILADGQDRRFNAIRNNPRMMFITWTLQGLWVILTLLPVLMVNQNKRDKPLNKVDHAGWTIWAVGFLLEVVADYQKSQFRTNPENAGKFITSGLWSLSRHPNYLGEICMWIGLYVSSSHMLRGVQHLSIISPIFTTLLLTKISGIPMLERSGMKRWGTDPNYLDYLKNTAVLVPYLY